MQSACAITFYKAVFGWTIEPAGGPVEYDLITTGPSTEPVINGAITRARPCHPFCIVNTIVNNQEWRLMVQNYADLVAYSSTNALPLDQVIREVPQA